VPHDAEASRIKPSAKRTAGRSVQPIQFVDQK